MSSKKEDEMKSKLRIEVPLTLAPRQMTKLALSRSQAALSATVLARARRRMNSVRSRSRLNEMCKAGHTFDIGRRHVDAVLR